MEDLDSLEDLVDLQAVDSEIDRLLDRRAGLPELAAYRKAHDELAGLEAEIAALADRVRESDLASDKSDGELKIDEEKAHREEQRLYAGGLSARDAEHLRAEVEMLRRRISEREDLILGLMEEREGLAASLSRLEGERDAVASEKGRIEEVIAESWSGIDAEVARLEEKKAGIVPMIDAELLALYEDIRPAKEGVGVARLAEGVCGGCHLALSAAEQLQAAKAFPPRCIHCRRILAL